MRAYIECSPSQSKTYTLSTFQWSNQQNFEDSRKVLAVSVSEFYQSIAANPTLTKWLSLLYVYKETTVSVRLCVIYYPNSFALTLRYCANFKAIRYESRSLNRVVADKSYRVIVA